MKVTLADEENGQAMPVECLTLGVVNASSALQRRAPAHRDAIFTRRATLRDISKSKSKTLAAQHSHAIGSGSGDALRAQSTMHQREKTEKKRQ